MTPPGEMNAALNAIKFEAQSLKGELVSESEAKRALAEQLLEATANIDRLKVRAQPRTPHARSSLHPTLTHALTHRAC